MFRTKNTSFSKNHPDDMQLLYSSFGFTIRNDCQTIKEKIKIKKLLFSCKTFAWLILEEGNGDERRNDKVCDT